MGKDDDSASLCSMRVQVSRSRSKRKSGLLRKSRRQVKFDDAATVVRNVESWAVDQEIRDDLWYNRDEYDIIRLRDTLLLDLFETGMFQESEEHSLRGLERRLDGALELQIVSTITLAIVLDEQNLQQAKGISSPERIAKAYSRVSRCAREKATSLALSDALEVHGRKVISKNQKPSNSLRDDVSMSSRSSRSSRTSMTSRSSKSSIASSSSGSLMSSGSTRNRNNRSMFFRRKSRSARSLVKQESR